MLRLPVDSGRYLHNAIALDGNIATILRAAATVDNRNVPEQIIELHLFSTPVVSCLEFDHLQALKTVKDYAKHALINDTFIHKNQRKQ